MTTKTTTGYNGGGGVVSVTGVDGGIEQKLLAEAATVSEGAVSVSASVVVVGGGSGRYNNDKVSGRHYPNLLAKLYFIIVFIVVY